jgi:hypothetical protein
MSVRHSSRRARRFVGHCACAVLLILAACSKARRPLPEPPAAPEVLLARVEAREAAIRTLRARFSSVATRGSEERRAEGVLLVKKPDRFRLRLLAPLGFTVFDYTSVAGRTHMVLPLRDAPKNAPPPADVPVSPADLQDTFLRGASAVPETCEPRHADGTVLVTCRDQDGRMLRLLSISPSEGTLSQEITLRDGQPRVVARYSDYRRVDSTQLPFAIEIAYPAGDVRMRIAVRSYEVNPALADDLFEPPKEAR